MLIQVGYVIGKRIATQIKHTKQLCSNIAMAKLGPEFNVYKGEYIMGSVKPGPLTCIDVKLDSGTSAKTKHQPPGPCMISQTDYFNSPRRMSGRKSSSRRTDAQLKATIAATVAYLEKNNKTFASMMMRIKKELAATRSYMEKNKTNKEFMDKNKSNKEFARIMNSKQVLSIDVPFKLFDSNTSGAHSLFIQAKNSKGKWDTLLVSATVYISKSFDNFFYPTKTHTNNYGVVITDRVARVDLPSVIFHEISHVESHSTHSSVDALVKTPRMGRGAGYATTIRRIDPVEATAINHTNKFLREPLGLPLRTTQTIKTFSEYAVETTLGYFGGYYAIKHRLDRHENSKISYVRKDKYKPLF